MKKIKIGILGTNARGMYLAKDFRQLECEITAVCEANPAKIEYGKEFFGDIPFYRIEIHC